MKIRSLLTPLLMLFLLDVQAGIVTENVSYRDGDTVMKGLIAYDDSIKGKRPGVLVVHEWWGHNNYARKRASMLAEMGYTALAVDMYGDGKTAEHPDDAGKFSGAVMSNMPIARARFEAAIDTLKKHSTVEKDKLAAIGYCFGGGVVLAMARLGVDLKGVASFHGSVATNTPARAGQVKAKIRVFNGAADPFVKPEHIEAFKQEMEAASVDYQLVNYPGVKHSFTNPGADAYGKKFNLPLVYNAEADKDSWSKTQVFFTEIFK